VSIGIGQGYNSYTPIQMAHATATLANRGVMFRPHAVNKIIDPITSIVTMVEPQPVRTMAWKNENTERVIRGMAGVIREGTGARTFAGANYIAAGKTGTAQVYSLKGSKYNKNISERLRDHSWFIVFAPVDKPTIALAVIVENGGFGAQAAAPIARQALDFYLNGKLPTPPKTSGAASSASNATTEEIVGD
jgi:penicillin-binding protein 2